MNKFRLEITFGEEDADIWGYLNDTGLPKASVIKKILRDQLKKDSINKKNSSFDEEQDVINGEIKKIVDELDIQIKRASSLHFEVQERFFNELMCEGNIHLNLKQKISFERYKDFVEIEGELYFKIINQSHQLSAYLNNFEK